MRAMLCREGLLLSGLSVLAAIPLGAFFLLYAGKGDFICFRVFCEDFCSRLCTAVCGYVPGIRSGGGTADRFPYKETGSGDVCGRWNKERIWPVYLLLRMMKY